MKNFLDIDRIAFIGRTYDEYIKIFDLDGPMMARGRVLDCPAGASSFTAEAYLKGIDATACDIMYNLDAHELSIKGKKDIGHVFEKFDEVSHLYTWGCYRNKEDVISRRKMALERFTHDFTKGLEEGRYVRGELPELPFPDNSFTLVLSSHFLFLYGDRLGFDFHANSLKELVRVCSGTVCVYPLTGLDAKPYGQINKVITSLEKTGTSVEIKKTPFEFQKGSGRIMLLSNKNGGDRDGFR